MVYLCASSIASPQYGTFMNTAVSVLRRSQPTQTIAVHGVDVACQTDPAKRRGSMGRSPRYKVAMRLIKKVARRRQRRAPGEDCLRRAEALLP